MATVPHVTSRLGLRKLQADGFLLTWVYHTHCFTKPITQPQQWTLGHASKHTPIQSWLQQPRGVSWKNML